jgi:hypothetical protein
MADLLGVSKRAVQSYEQHRRHAPPPVRKLAALMLYQHWQKDHARPAPCWEQHECSHETRESCFTYQARADGLCWMMTGSIGANPACKTRPNPQRDCLTCPVMTQWLDCQTRAAHQ